MRLPEAGTGTLGDALDSRLAKMFRNYRYGMGQFVRLIGCGTPSRGHHGYLREEEIPLAHEGQEGPQIEAATGVREAVAESA